MLGPKKLNRATGAILLAGATAMVTLLAGCGMPAAPQPPSLKLPNPVDDLAAARTGDEVALTWTMPRRDTDKVALKGQIAARICRRESATIPCATVATLELLPSVDGKFAETLPPALASGTPRALEYHVELLNRRGRSAGLSNAAVVLAGEAPAPVGGLGAELRKDGVVLRWTPGPPEPFSTQMRLKRTLLTPVKRPQTQGPLSAPAEQAEQNLLVPETSVHGQALDNSIRFGETYAYRAQRITRVNVDGKPLELDGPLSPPVCVDVENIFPPAVPAGLAAVATPAENGAGPAIDLSWQPDTEADLAGYAVYRREGDGPWQRISPPQPVVGPGFHDANVQPGHTYEYAVTAIGQNGHESARSGPAEETVPGP
jgi:hypothetical protein